jgi:hypothetical protein
MEGLGNTKRTELLLNLLRQGGKDALIDTWNWLPPRRYQTGGVLERAARDTPLPAATATLEASANQREQIDATAVEPTQAARSTTRTRSGENHTFC